MREYFDEDEEQDDYCWPQEREDYYKFIEDDYWGDDYYDEPLVPLSLKDRILCKIYEIKWHITEFWNYKLGMYRCPDCKKRYCFNNHNDCIPF